MAQSIAELVALKHDGDNKFRSRHNPVKMGNAADIAYGETLSMALEQT